MELNLLTLEDFYALSPPSLLWSSPPPWSSPPCVRSSCWYSDVVLCRNPYVKDFTGRSWRLSYLADHPDIKRQLRLKSTPFPCGQCLPCRINKRRVWTCRLILESLCHPYASFITLTYDEAHIPENRQLCKRDAQLFLKRLRYYLHGRRIRYYLCGEYGEQFGRPHYHAVLFNVHPYNDADAIVRSWSGLVRNEQGLLDVIHADKSERTQVGNVVIGTDCSDAAIQYVAGYVTKKFVKRDSGDVPEFSIMSLRPAIGVPFLSHIKKMMENPRYEEIFDETGGGLPLEIRLGGRRYPLGRTLRYHLGLLCGKEPDFDGWLDSHGETVLEALGAGARLDDYFSRIDDARARRVEARFKLYSRRPIE